MTTAAGSVVNAASVPSFQQDRRRQGHGTDRHGHALRPPPPRQHRRREQRRADEQNRGGDVLARRARHAGRRDEQVCEGDDGDASTAMPTPPPTRWRNTKNATNGSTTPATRKAKKAPSGWSAVTSSSTTNSDAIDAMTARMKRSRSISWRCSDGSSPDWLLTAGTNPCSPTRSLAQHDREGEGIHDRHSTGRASACAALRWRHDPHRLYCARKIPDKRAGSGTEGRCACTR